MSQLRTKTKNHSDPTSGLGNGAELPDSVWNFLDHCQKHVSLLKPDLLKGLQSESGEIANIKVVDNRSTFLKSYSVKDSGKQFDKYHRTTGQCPGLPVH